MSYLSRYCVSVYDYLYLYIYLNLASAEEERLALSVFLSLAYFAFCLIQEPSIPSIFTANGMVLVLFLAE